VAFDEHLAGRIRELLGTHPGLSEKKMFGGLAFLVDGNLAIAASGQGGLLVRVDPAQSDSVVHKTKATVAIMRGRAMTGWLRVDAAAVGRTTQLAKWVTLGTDAARSLPAKQPTTRPAGRLKTP
jgi:TfoX/Sxy family transcriptional regulator of competence genes